MSIIKSGVPFLLLFIAIIQLLAIGEKGKHALWQWFKFYGSSNTGSTTFSLEMFWFTVIASIIGIVSSRFLFSWTDSKFGSRVVKLSGMLLSIGLGVLLLLIVSPLGQFR
jgi:uncharacterized membrane protein